MTLTENGMFNDWITVEDIMTTLIDHTKGKHSRRDTQKRHRMRRLLDATSTQVNTYKHQGSHIWRSKPFKNMEEAQVSESEAVKTRDQIQTKGQDGTQAEDVNYQVKDERIAGTQTAEAEASNTEASSTEAATQLIQTMLQGVNAHRRCSCERCSECRLENQNFRHRAASEIRRTVKEIEWLEGVEQMVLVFGHEQEAIEEGNVKARGHLAKVRVGTCQNRFEHEAQQQDEITVLEDASGLIYGVQQQNHDCKLEAMVKIRLVSTMEAVTILSRKKDLKERVIDCTDYDEMIWIMQGTY